MSVEDNENEPSSEEAADAWAAVLIDIHEKRRGKDRDSKDQESQECQHNESSPSPS